MGGGLHGHVGLLKSVADYELLAPGTPFIAPLNLEGIYPAVVFPAAQRGQREAEHKELIRKFEKCTGAGKGLKELILQVIDKDFLLEQKVPGIAYLKVSALQMITHLLNRWGLMDFVDITVYGRMQFSLGSHKSSDQAFQSGGKGKKAIGKGKHSNMNE